MANGLRRRIAFSVLMLCLLMLSGSSGVGAQSPSGRGVNLNRSAALMGIGAHPGAPIPAPLIVTFPFMGSVGDTIGISGAYFTGATSVKFNGVNSRSFHVDSDSLIMAVIPPGARTGPISVTTGAGTGVSSINFYIGPIIESFSPHSGVWGTAVTIIGRNLSDATDVKFNGVSVAHFNIVSDTKITTNVPSGATSGFINITSINGGSVFGVPAFNIGPIVESFSPTSGSPGDSVTITGSGFSGATSVKFNGVSAPILSRFDTQIETRVPQGATTGWISVTTPSGSTYSPSAFYIGPYITSFSPKSGRPGTVVTLNGHNFIGASYVQFSGVSADYAVLSDTVIRATVPVGAGKGKIGVTTPLGRGFSFENFTVGPPISGFSPASGIVGDTVTINGSGFTSVSAVKFNGVFSAAQNVSDTSVTAVVPAATTGPISVVTPSGTGVSADSFIVGPIITGFTSSSASVGGIVKIFGKNFTGATAVGFNGAITVPFNISDTNLSAAVPAGATSGAISVTTPSGTGSSSENFIAPPRITGFDPASGSVGTLVTITGTNFTGATAVKFHGVAAKTFSVDSDTVIKAVAPPGATTGQISVVMPSGTGTSFNNFTVTAGVAAAMAH